MMRPGKIRICGVSSVRRISPVRHERRRPNQSSARWSLRYSHISVHPHPSSSSSRCSLSWSVLSAIVTQFTSNYLPQVRKTFAAAPSSTPRTRPPFPDLCRFTGTRRPRGRRDPETVYNNHYDRGTLSDTGGCTTLTEFATPGWRISVRTYSHQYEQLPNGQPDLRDSPPGPGTRHLPADITRRDGVRRGSGPAGSFAVGTRRDRPTVPPPRPPKKRAPDAHRVYTT